MRVFCCCVFCLFALGAPIPPTAAAAPADDVAGNPVVVPGRSAADYYGYATDHLKRGRWFERAAAQLKESVRQEPGDYQYHLALGCALASRAASLAYAAGFTHALYEYRGSYPQALAEWEKAQKDPESDEHGEPRPEPPPTVLFRTKDDDRPFRLTKAQADARVADLGKAAKAEWGKAFASAKTDAERAEAHYVRGWGLRLLQRCTQPPLQLEALQEVMPAPTSGAPAEALEAFTAATKLAPDVAAYWQSFGDALGNRTEASAAYRRSLALETRNPTLWYRLYRWNTDKPPAPPEDDDVPPLAPTLAPDPRRGLEDLRQAALADPTNAFPLYELAAGKFKETRYGEILGSSPDRRDAALDSVAAAANDANRAAAGEAVEYIERGNRAVRYAPPVYRPAVPRLLSAAWEYYRQMDILQYPELARFREPARAACGYALASAKGDNVREAERASRAVIGMGRKIAGGWPAGDSSGRSNRIVDNLLGGAIAAIGHNNLEKVYRMVGDENRADRALAEYAAAKQRNDAYSKALQEELARPEISVWLEMY